MNINVHILMRNCSQVRSIARTEPNVSWVVIKSLGLFNSCVTSTVLDPNFPRQRAFLATTLTPLNANA